MLQRSCAGWGAAVLLSAAVGLAQQADSFTKTFKKFPRIAAGIDMFAENQAAIAPFVKPLSDARAKLALFLGEDLAPGAVVVCSTLEAKDSVNERRVLRLGYRWVLIQTTPEVAAAQMIQQIKSQTGGQVPPGMMDRLQSPEMKSAGEARLVASTVQRWASAVILTTLAPEKEFRASRVDDSGQSPLEDWLDVGLASHASGGGGANLRMLQDRLDESFPLEDVIGMSRPFVPPGAAGSGPQMVIRMGGPGPGGSTAGGAIPATGGGAGHGGAAITRGASMPKDVADRMMFDSQASALFRYLVEKVGAAQVRGLVAWNRDAKPARDFLSRPDILGPDFEAAEKAWHDWVKAQKADSPGQFRIMTGPPGAAGTPPPGV